MAKTALAWHLATGMVRILALQQKIHMMHAPLLFGLKS